MHFFRLEMHFAWFQNCTRVYKWKSDVLEQFCIKTVRHGLLCSVLLIPFLISSPTLGRQTELNNYGNIVGRHGLEFSRSFALYIQERSGISIYSSLTRYAFGGFCNSDELWISFAVEICFVSGYPLLGSNIPPLSILFVFGGGVFQCAGSLIRDENISNKEFHAIQTLLLVSTLWNCVLY